MMGALMGYIHSIQQIVFDVFRRPELIAIIFAGVAGPMAVTSYANSRLVERLGTRRLAHFGLCAFTLVSASTSQRHARREPLAVRRAAGG